MRTIWWFLYFWGYLVFLLPKFSKAKKLEADGREEEKRAVVNEVVQSWATNLLKIGGVDVDVKGLENIPKEAALFVSNHEGNFDIPILLSKLDEAKSIVAKIQMEKLPFLPGWMKLFDCVFIDRDNPRQCIKVLGKAEELLKLGKSVIIFPEGTRSKSKELGEFKSGAFKIALKAKVPVVPVVINGSYKIMEENKIWIKPGRVSLTILPPVETAELTKEQARNLNEDVKGLIRAELEREL